MNTLKSRILALVMLVAVLVSFALPTYAAGQPSSYSSSTNSGERDFVCTTLDGTTAAGYYTGSYSYDNLSSQSSSALLQSLRTLMTSTHKRTTSYSDCKNYANSTDCENNSGKLVTLYTSYTTYYNASTINREHVWPKSLGGFDTEGPGADLHHIRPTEITPNSNRDNLRYGEVTGGKTSIGNASGYEAGTYGSFFEPLDNVKGDVARICLYMYARYGGTAGYTCSNINKVFQSVDVLLAWCELDPVDTWEMGRNEVIYAIQGNRNVFIDYPELAWLIFDEAVPTNMPTPSGRASGGTAGGNTGSGGNGGGTDTPVDPPADEGPFLDATPSVGTAYKFGMLQENLSATYYLAGGMSGYYMATTTDPDSAIDVYLEAASGGYYLYTKFGSTKQYINMVVSSDGQHVNGEYSPTAKTVYTIDPNLKSVVATVDGAAYHFGTRNDKTYDTVGPCKVSYAGFVCQFYTDTKPTGCTHSGTVVKNAATPTCAQKGYTGDTYCAECNELLTLGRELPVTENHTFTAWESTAGGKQTRECTTCGKTEEKTVSSTDCKHENTEVINDKPLCSEGAYTGDTVCADCGKVLVEGMSLPPMGHDFVDGAIITEPTDTAKGMQEQTCSYCGTVNVKVIPALKGGSGGANVPLIAGVSGGSAVLLVAVFLIIRKRII